MRKALENNPDIKIISNQDSCIFSFTSNTFNAMAICEQMRVRRRWMLGKVQRPAGAHLTVTDANKDSWKDFVDSINDCVQAMKKDSKLNTNEDTALYCMTGNIPDKSLLHQFVSVHEAAMLDTLE